MTGFRTTELCNEQISLMKYILIRLNMSIVIYLKGIEAIRFCIRFLLIEKGRERIMRWLHRNWFERN